MLHPLVLRQCFPTQFLLKDPFMTFVWACLELYFCLSINISTYFMKKEYQDGDDFDDTAYYDDVNDPFVTCSLS